MRVGVMWWGILKETAVSAEKSDIYSLHINIKANRACSSVRYNGPPHSGWNNIYWMFGASNYTVIDRVKSFNHIVILLKQTGLHVMKDLTGSLLIKALTGLQLTMQQTVSLIKILLERGDL